MVSIITRLASVLRLIRFKEVFFAICFCVCHFLAQAQTISIIHSPVTTLKAGDVVTYTVTAKNTTSATISNVIITSDTLPGAPMRFVANSLTVSGTNLTCTVPSTITNAINISGFDLLPNESIVYTFQMRVPSDYVGSTTVSHTATLNPGAASHTVSNMISSLPTLTVTKTGKTDVTAGTVNKTGLIYYTMVVTNTGTATAKSVVLKDALDTLKAKIVAADLVIVSQTYLGTYTINKGNSTLHDSVRVTLGDIPGGGSATIQFRVRVKPAATGSITNTATATSTNATTATSNTATHTINAGVSCANRNVFYLSFNGNNASAEVNNPYKPWQSFLQIINAINAQGGFAIVRFLDAYYPSSVSGSTAPVLTTPCVTIDGNYCLFNRNSGAGVGFLLLQNGANGDTIRNIRLTNFNRSPYIFEATGTSPASPITGLVMDDVKIYACQSVKASSLTNISGAKFINCEWSNNPFGALDIVDVKATFTDCNFYCNTRGGFGGAVDARIKSGGAGSDAHFTDLTFTRGEFSGNSATGGGGDGGALSVGVGTLTIDGTKFNCNSSDSPTGTAGGGALRLQSNSGSSGKPIVSIKNAVFYTNTCTSGTDGGAILGTSTGALTLDKCIFKNNVSGSGSAINVSSPFTINNCIFEGNSTGAAVVGSPSVMDSTTVKGNTGAGVSGTIGTLSNSLVCGNTGTNMSAHPTTTTNSLYGTNAEAINNTQVSVVNEPASSATAGWTFTNPTSILPLNSATSQGTFVFTNTNTTNDIQQAANGFGGVGDGFWLLEEGDIIETPVLNMLNFPASITVAYKARRIQSNAGQTSTTQSVSLEYSTNGGGSWTAANTFVVGAAWADATAFTIPACATATMKLRWFRLTAGATRQDVGIDNIQITYNTTAIQQGATNWLLEPTDVIESPNINLTGYSTAFVQYQIAGNGTGTYMPGLFEYSLDGGTIWSTPVTTQTPSTTTLPNVNAFASALEITLGSTSISNFKMRFTHNGGCGRSLKVDNITVTGANPITCASAMAGSGLTVGTYACLSACPTTPTNTTNCITFADLGEISLSGCKFLNTYTGDFASGTPVMLPSGVDAQSFNMIVSNFFPVNSPANTYSWRFLVVNASDEVVQVVTPSTYPAVTNTTLTPNFTPVVAGTYKVYGYYYNENSANAPTLGTTLAALATDICGSLSKNFATFEILTPIVETVTSSCIQNAQYACPNRFFGTITVTGGYPSYAQSKGLAVPPYLIGIDKTYTPTNYGKEMSSYVALGSSATYISTTGQNIGVKTEDDGNCTTYPFALDVAAFA
ncbi:MAG: hypothetical protein ACKVTZ_22630, partial [Bacteroidia bacterium]